MELGRNEGLNAKLQRRMRDDDTAGTLGPFRVHPALEDGRDASMREGSDPRIPTAEPASVHRLNTNMPTDLQIVRTIAAERVRAQIATTGNGRRAAEPNALHADMRAAA